MAYAVEDGGRKYFLVSGDDMERLILDKVPECRTQESYGASVDVELLVVGIPKDWSVANVYNLFRCATDLVEVRLSKCNRIAARRYAFLKFFSNVGAEEAIAKYSDLEVEGSKLEVSTSLSHKTLIIEKINEHLFDEVIKQDLSSRTFFATSVTIVRSARRLKSCYAYYRNQNTAYLAYKRLVTFSEPTICGYRVSVEPIPLPYQEILSQVQFMNFEILRTRDALACRKSGARGDLNNARLVAEPIHSNTTIVDLLTLFGVVPGLVEIQLQHKCDEGQQMFASLQYESAQATQMAFDKFHNIKVRGQKMTVLPEAISPICTNKKTFAKSLQTQDVCIRDATGQAHWFHLHQSNGQHIGRLAGANTQEHPELYVASLETHVTLFHLLDVFAKVGHLTEVRLMIGFSGFNRGFAFVRYRDDASAKQAIDMFNKAKVFGKRLAVQMSTNSKSLLISHIPQHMINSDVETILRKFTSGVRSVLFLCGSLGGPSNKCCLVNYVDHRSATTARRNLIPHCRDIFRCKLDIDWAPVNKCEDNEDKSYLEDLVVPKWQDYKL